MTLSPEITRQARCIGLLDLVDAAFDRPGGPAGQRMAALCSGCPIWRECLGDAVANGEHGPWGGTGRKRRSNFVLRNYTFNIVGVHHGLGQDLRGHAPGAHNVLLTAIGVTAIDVKRWAIETGLAESMTRGTPSLELVQAYADAHHLTAA